MIGDIETILEALNRAHVRYLVVGGVAVVLHGYLRTTAGPTGRRRPGVLSLGDRT